MIEGYPRLLTTVAAAGARLSAGVFFAFSSSVMQALGRLPAPQGIAAMQAINRQAPSPLSMTALFGTAAVCVLAAVGALGRLAEPWAAYVLVAAALYLVVSLLTVVYHVPRNGALALVDPHGPATADLWRTYRHGWTGWNHVRTLASLASAIAFTLSLRVGSPERSQDLQPPNHRRTWARMRGLGDQRTPCADVVCSRYGTERIGVDSNRGVAVSQRSPRRTTTCRSSR